LTSVRSIAVFCAALALAACKKDTPVESYNPPPPETTAKPKTEDQAIAEIKQNFQRVHFEFDSSSLTTESKAALSKNAELLQKFPSIRVEVQGHADERGTTEYNLALGEKRAQSIVKQLALLGVDGARLEIVSFGEEKPLQSGSDESAWAVNRRAEFRVFKNSDVPVDGTI